MLGVFGQSRATRFCFVLCLLFTTRRASGQFTTVLNLPPDPDIGDFQSIGSNEQLNLSDGGTIGSFFQAGAFDGTSTNVEVNVSGGTIDDFFYTFSGSTVNVSGGSIGDDFNAAAFHGASTNVEVNISGGSIGKFFKAFSGSTVNISGGSFGNDFDASSGSVVNLFGTQFVLNSNDITASLTPNVPFTINDRDVTLSSLLADGSPFSLDLNSTDAIGEDSFDPGALLSVTLIQLGDFDGDGDVDGTDFLAWQLGESPDPFSASDLAAWEANFVTVGDFDLDGDVDGADFLKWQRGESPNPFSASDLANWEANYGAGIAPLSGNAATVPEPTSSALLLTSLICTTFRRRP